MVATVLVSHAIRVEKEVAKEQLKGSWHGLVASWPDVSFAVGGPTLISSPGGLGDDTESF